MAKATEITNLKVKKYKDKAIVELDLMYEAIQAGDYKKAMHHKIIANVAIEEMIAIEELLKLR